MTQLLEALQKPAVVTTKPDAEMTPEMDEWPYICPMCSTRRKITKRRLAMRCSKPRARKAMKKADDTRKPAGGHSGHSGAPSQVLS